MRKVRIAVIGAGAFGQRHLSYLQREPLCEVVAVADPAPAAAEVAAACGYRYFSDYNAMLDAVRPEGAIIASAKKGNFIAGADLFEIRKMDRDQLGKYLLEGQRLFQRISMLPFPTAASVSAPTVMPEITPCLPAPRSRS